MTGYRFLTQEEMDARGWQWIGDRKMNGEDLLDESVAYVLLGELQAAISGLESDNKLEYCDLDSVLGQKTCMPIVLKAFKRIRQDWAASRTAFPEIETICTCGHKRSDHAEEMPYECNYYESGIGIFDETCECKSFTYATVPEDK